jgi:hypothetical protein
MRAAAPSALARVRGAHDFDDADWNDALRRQQRRRRRRRLRPLLVAIAAIAVVLEPVAGMSPEPDAGKLVRRTS